MPELSYDELVDIRTNCPYLSPYFASEVIGQLCDTALWALKGRDEAAAASRAFMAEIDRWGEAAHVAGAERDRAAIELRALRDRIQAVLRDYPTSAVPAICIQKALEP